MSGYGSHAERLLAFSVEQYRELDQHAEKLLNMLGNCDYSRVENHAIQLEELQAAASKQDAVLIPLLSADFSAWEGHSLYRLRLKFIHSILALNELLLPKIRGMMAVTSAELSQLQGGRTALAGYAKHASQRSLRGVG